MSIIQPNAVVLFQGDSITDCGRDRANHKSLGFGYAAMAAAWFSALYPESGVTFLNRGISGNRVKDLLAAGRTIALRSSPTGYRS